MIYIATAFWEHTDDGSSSKAATFASLVDICLNRDLRRVDLVYFTTNLMFSMAHFSTLSNTYSKSVYKGVPRSTERKHAITYNDKSLLTTSGEPECRPWLLYNHLFSSDIYACSSPKQPIQTSHSHHFGSEEFFISLRPPSSTNQRMQDMQPRAK